MREPYLEVTYRHGRPVAAYYYLPGASDGTSARSRRVEPGLVVDYSAAGEPLGIEITAPTKVTLEDFNRLLAELGLPALAEAEFAPLHAMPSPAHGETHWRTTRMSLIQRAADSSPGASRDDAWRELIETYRRPITVCMRRRVGRHPDGEAIVDEFFGYLFTEDVLARMDPEQGRFRAFLQGVMRRYVLRKLHESRASGGDEGFEGLLVVDPPPSAEAEEEWTWARSLLDHAVEQLLDAMPRDGKILLQVHGIHPYEETDTAEIAAAHGLSLNAVHQALRRARKELRRRLESQIAQLADGEEDYEAEKQALIGRLKQARPELLE